jgi:hypothetical protein
MIRFILLDPTSIMQSPECLSFSNLFSSFPAFTIYLKDFFLYSDPNPIVNVRSLLVFSRTDLKLFSAFLNSFSSTSPSVRKITTGSYSYVVKFISKHEASIAALKLVPP